jgi:hypothetical protein
MNKPIPIKEIQIIDAEEVQQILIRNDWFALATDKEYAQFLDYVQRLEETHVTLEDLRQMAVDVMRYSDPDTYDQEMGIPGIMFELARAVHSIYTETIYTETQERAAKCINAVTLLAQIEKDLRKTVDEKGAENSSMHEPYKIIADSIYIFIMAEIEKCPAADADMI